MRKYLKEKDARIVIDDMLRRAGWEPADKSQVLTEITVYGQGGEKQSSMVKEGFGSDNAVLTTSDGDYIPTGRADYGLLSRDGPPLSVVEAKKAAI